MRGILCIHRWFVDACNWLYGATIIGTSEPPLGGGGDRAAKESIRKEGNAIPILALTEHSLDTAHSPLTDLFSTIGQSSRYATCQERRNLIVAAEPVMALDGRLVTSAIVCCSTWKAHATHQGFRKISADPSL